MITITKSHEIYALSNVERNVSLSNAISCLPLNTFQSQFVISRDKSSFRETFNFLFEDKLFQSHAFCLVLSNKDLSIISCCPWERIPQSQSFS